MDDEDGIKVDVQALSPMDLDKLSDEQVQYVRDQAMRKRNPRITAIVQEALKDKSDEIIAGLSREPYAYITPEIELMPGLKIRFRSLYTFQTRDVSERTAEFIKKTRATEMLAAQYMNQLFLVHGIETINGEPLGLVQLPEGVWNFEGDKIAVAMDGFVPKRMRALDARPQSLVSAFVTANQVFQELYDDVVNLRGSNKAEIEAKAEKLVAAVGKSTGPQVAGQKPT